MKKTAALNRTMHHLARKKQSLDDFTYNDAVIAGEIYSAMNATQFLGVSVSTFHFTLLFPTIEENFVMISVHAGNSSVQLER